MSSLPHSLSAPGISREIADVLIDGRYGMMLSRDRETRFLRVAEIASLYTRHELLREIGFRPSTVAIVQRWLAHHGRRLRDRREPIEAAICRFDIGSCRAGSAQAESAKRLPLVSRQQRNVRAELSA